ncbi:MAG: hypothetical protein U9Q92_06030 [archaeon]|nr:hypothetical protein [archaeon]
MDAKEIEDLLKAFRWNTLQRMYGCAHNSIIGFISTEWISQLDCNSILDGAPSPITGNGRMDQKNADIILCRGNKPFIIVEVETSVDKYPEKIKTLSDYLNKAKYFDDVEFGLLFMSNLQNGERKYQHNWDEIKEKIKEKNDSIALISINKEKVSLCDDTLSHLRKRNDYSPWNIVKIDYWIHKKGQSKIAEGNLWKK